MLKLLGNYAFLCILFGALALCSCSKSPPPSISNLHSISAPGFTGVNAQGFINTASHATTVNGTCDPKSTQLDYSLDDQATWNPIPGGCTAAGQFSFNVTVTTTVDVYARAEAGVQSLTSSRATVRYLLPPTSNFLTLLNSSSSGDTNATQNAMGEFDGTTMQSSGAIVTSYLPGVTYDP